MLDVYRSRLCGGFSVHVVAEELNLVDDERLCLDLHFLPFPCALVGGLSVDFHGGEGRRNLLYGPDELLQRLLHELAGDVAGGVCAVLLCLHVERRRCCAQLEGCHIFFCPGLKLVNLLRCLSGADDEHAGGKRVEGSGMAHLHLLDAQLMAQNAPHFRHEPERCHGVGLVEAEYVAFFGVEHIRSPCCWFLKKIRKVAR